MGRSKGCHLSAGSFGLSTGITINHNGALLIASCHCVFQVGCAKEAAVAEGAWGRQGRVSCYRCCCCGCPALVAKCR